MEGVYCVFIPKHGMVAIYVTFPRLLVVPASLSDPQLEGAAKYRVGGRLPTLVARWHYMMSHKPTIGIRTIVEFHFNFFYNPTADTIRVANSPRIGVGPGFDSQGCVTFLSQILLSQLVLNPLGHFPG